jgi:hypothetical protein
MDIKMKYGWQELYATAVLETDWTKIEQKIQTAENVIGARLHEFSLNHGGTPVRALSHRRTEIGQTGCDSRREGVMQCAISVFCAPWGH